MHIEGTRESGVLKIKKPYYKRLNSEHTKCIVEFTVNKEIIHMLADNESLGHDNKMLMLEEMLSTLRKIIEINQLLFFVVQ